MTEIKGWITTAHIRKVVTNYAKIEVFIPDTIRSNDRLTDFLHAYADAIDAWDSPQTDVATMEYKRGSAATVGVVDDD